MNRTSSHTLLNPRELDILTVLAEEPFINQRILAELSGHSLGVVNKAIHNLMQIGYLDETVALTDKAKREFQEKAPKNAIILAAGFGMRMVPINMEMPKGLLEVNGEPLIERLIKQLHEVGVNDITIVVGFMSERFEYLIDKYGVNLVVNAEYAKKNNLHSLNLVADKISNTYIVPCDLWCDRNPFSTHELYSWYMVSDVFDEDSTVRVSRKMELINTPRGNGGNGMIGISYLLEVDAARVREKLQLDWPDDVFWEETITGKEKMTLTAKVAHAADVVEINTYEQLRELDEESNQLKNSAITLICRQFGASPWEVQHIQVLKKGMTNRSFLFSCKGGKYVMRIPGEGTDKLIDRKQEAAVYAAIQGRGLCDDPVYFNPENGYKITRYIEGVRCCDPDNVKELRECMKKLRAFHESQLTVDHEFDLFAKMDFYESLWGDMPSAYRDYALTKQKVLSLRPFIESQRTVRCLTHIDAVPDNFLYASDGTLQLTDWEYAGMQDPHVDIAMFCIYSLYNKRQVDRLIDLYFEGKCETLVRAKIYCYIAVCGLLWSNWCEYKRSLGVEFGEYALRQYRYAKDYYKHAMAEMKEGGMDVQG